MKSTKTIHFSSLLASVLLLAAAALTAAPALAQGDGEAHCHDMATDATADAASEPREADAADRQEAEADQVITRLDIPDLELLDEEGDRVHFASDLIAGKTVVMNFIFTTCTTICPPMGAHFAKLQKQLEAEGRDVELISVSIDPNTDTPQRLAAWRERLGGSDDGWTLVTGPKQQVDRLLKALAVFTPDATDHAPVALVGDGDSGTFRRVYGLAPPATLLSVLDELADADSEAVAAAAAAPGGVR